MCLPILYLYVYYCCIFYISLYHRNFNIIYNKYALAIPANHIKNIPGHWGQFSVFFKSSGTGGSCYVAQDSDIFISMIIILRTCDSAYAYMRVNARKHATKSIWSTLNHLEEWFGWNRFECALRQCAFSVDAINPDWMRIQYALSDQCGQVKNCRGMMMVTQVIRVLHKLELGPRAAKITRCVSNLRTL